MSLRLLACSSLVLAACLAARQSAAAEPEVGKQKDVPAADLKNKKHGGNYVQFELTLEPGGDYRIKVDPAKGSAELKILLYEHNPDKGQDSKTSKKAPNNGWAGSIDLKVKNAPKTVWVRVVAKTPADLKFLVEKTDK
jgi:hypothetical protein